jgi:hypothetical protein
MQTRIGPSTRKPTFGGCKYLFRYNKSKQNRLISPSAATIFELMGNGGDITQQPAVWDQEVRNFMALATWDHGQLQDRRISDIWPAEKFPNVASHSHELQDLVKRCFNYTPDDMPTLLAARRTIDDVWNLRYTRRDSRVIGPVQPHWEREFVLGEPFPSLALPILPPTHN